MTTQTQTQPSFCLTAESLSALVARVKAKRPGAGPRKISSGARFLLWLETAAAGAQIVDMDLAISAFVAAETARDPAWTVGATPDKSINSQVYLMRKAGKLTGWTIARHPQIGAALMRA